MYGIAQDLGLAGFVLNDERGVTVEVEGPSPKLEAFATALSQRVPPLAHVDYLSAMPVPPKGETGFTIIASKAGQARNTLISPDVAICDDCLAELLDPTDRRFQYPFINCTNCGPRFTIIQDIPYDWEKTTMRVFPMCAACQAEYDDPLARRFHQGGRLIAFGEGARASDAQHVSVEFVHPVIVGKRALPAISLTNESALLRRQSFARRLSLLARPQDIAMGFSGGGQGRNILAAMEVAREMGLLTLGLSGGDGGWLAQAGLDFYFSVESDDPLTVQETHETLYHVLWELVHIYFKHEGLLS